jgi:hypothetical protein
MQTATQRGAETKEGATGPVYVALDCEPRAGVETACAAYHLNRRPQTLRFWAAMQTGPIRPLRVNGRLMWPTQKLRELCGVSQ